MASVSQKPISDIDKENDSNRENSQLLYSLILIFLIPVAIIVNTFWGISKIQKNMENELQKKAVLAADVFAGAGADSLTSEAALQLKIDEIIKLNSDLREVTVLKPLEDGFEVMASSNEESVGLIFKSLQYTTSWVEGKDITAISESDSKPSDRYFVIIAPLKNTTGEKVALLNMKSSLAGADRAMTKTMNQTLILLGITIFFVLILLFNHFRFYEYAMLLKRLKEVDKMKDDFISMVSHELKTPMAAIKGYMDMIFEGVAGNIDQKAKVHLEKISANVKRLDALIDAFLDISRLEQGRMQFDMQAIDISKVIAAISSELKIQADEKKLKITYEPMPDPHSIIFADQDRLAQMFDNVIGNAIKYTQKGSINIFHRIENGNLKTIIQDTGIGMSKQDMKGLFTKFYRIKNEKTADIAGTGLGLWITKEIITKMNGEIYAESQENIGSAFTISFPIMKESKES